LTAMW